MNNVYDRGNGRINIAFRGVRVTTVVVEKATCITHSDCVSVGLVTQHTKRRQCIILLSMSCLPLPYFSTQSRKCHDFRKEKLLTVCFIFSMTLVRDFYSTKNSTI